MKNNFFIQSLCYIVLFIMPVSALCANQKANQSNNTQATQVSSYDKIGYASWYGKKFLFKKTANDEHYYAIGMTAASRDLPLNSYAQVINLQTGKNVIVRINDRGPYAGDRIIDLSYLAAQELGFNDKGVMRVRVKAIKPTLWQKLK